MTLVPDASVLVAALVDGGDTGAWAEQLLTSEPLAGPHLLGVEVASVLRRAVAAGELSSDVAALAHADLLDLRVELVGYAPVGERVWELHENVTPYDAWYVAVAELLDAPLATLDRRLAEAPGPRCEIVVPP